MGAMSPMHWILLLLVVLVLFGTGRISSVMGDFAKGIKAFKRNMAEDDVSMEADSRPAAPAGTISSPDIAAAKRPETTGAPHA
jgi:sec-independent protein translocase protein TatA